MPASSLTADCYGPYPQVGSQSGNNTVHTLGQWSLFNRARCPSSGKSSRPLCRARRDVAGGGSDPGSEWDSDSGGSTTVARYFVPRIFIRFHHYYPAAALHLVVGNTEEVLDHLRQHRVGLGLVEGLQRSPGVRLEQFMPDEIVPVCAPRIPDPKLRRAIEGLKSVRDLEALPLIWRESGSGTRAVVESKLLPLRLWRLRSALGASLLWRVGRRTRLARRRMARSSLTWSSATVPGVLRHSAARGAFVRQRGFNTASVFCFKPNFRRIIFEAISGGRPLLAA